MTTTTKVLWAVFISILLVLLPHTAWLFRQFEPAEGVRIIGEFDVYDLQSNIAAFAFEAAIAALIHKLAKHWEDPGLKRKKGWDRIAFMYLNPFTFALLIATVISMLANLAHAVEFGRDLLIFGEWGIPREVYSLAFGGVLPVVSMTFARVLSNVSHTEDGPNPELEEAKARVREANRKAAEAEQRLNEILEQTEARVKATEAQAKALVEDAERRAREAEGMFGSVEWRALHAEDKRERILAIKQWKPQLSGNAIAVIAEASPAYVSEVLKEMPIDVTEELLPEKAEVGS